MKLEHETGFAVKTPPRKSYNPFDSDDEGTEGFVKNNAITYDIKSFEENAESLTFHLDNDNLSWEEAILGHSSILTPASPADANGEDGLFRKDTELFTDKNVTECELPELMVCYKENSYHSVKDIGIDEGVFIQDKAWVKSNNHESENLSSFLALNGDTNGDLNLGNEHHELPFIEELKSMPEIPLEKDAFIQDLTEDTMKCSRLNTEDLERQRSASQCGTDDSTKVEESKHDLSKKDSESNWQSTGDNTDTDVMIYDTKHHQLTQTDELKYAKVDNKGNEVSEVEHDNCNVSLEHVKDSFTKDSIMNSTEVISEHCKSQMEEPTSPQSSELPVSQESAGSDVVNALSYNSKVESGSIILDFEPSSTVSEKKEEDKEKTQQDAAAEMPLESRNIPVEKPPKTQTMSRHVDGAPAMDNWAYGETSFSTEMPPPASITYMGPNARSGSISLRSESSAGSTRSFAFPVLQTEWNSSPVRMAKADKRHIHKHRGWVHSVMCCRF